MSMKRVMTAAAAALGVVLGLPATVAGQQGSQEKPSVDATIPADVLSDADVVLKVNGMVCPFCAYGLEQRLEAIPSVDAVLVRVSDGVVQIRTKEGQELADEVLADQVKKAGFVLTETQRIEG